jgi:hypothetical protein
MTTSNSYLLQEYGITLAERQAIVDEQGGKCAACGRVFDGTVRMEVDHDHKIARTKLIIERLRDWNWAAFLNETDASCIAIGSTRKEARKKGQRELLRRSVRGVLCGGRYAGCNRKIGRIDKIPWLQAVTQYLQNPPARKVLRIPNEETNRSPTPSSDSAA